MKKLIILGFVIGIAVKLFIFDVLTISGSSMEPNISANSKVIVLKSAYGLKVPFSSRYLFRWKNPEKNDVVTFLHNNRIVIKRCVLTSKDSIEIITDSGYYLNLGGKTIPLSEEQYSNLSASSSVPDGYIFVLGDNSADSIDSRDYGFVAVKDITGKALIHE